MVKRSPDIADFSMIVNEYHNMIFRTAMGFVHSKEDAEDITQETFLKAYRALNKFKGDSEISTWLYRIAVNTSLNFLKHKNNRRVIFNTDNNLIERVNNAGSVENNPEQKVIKTETDRLVKDAIDSLPEKQRTAFILSRYNDLSQKQVAVIMNTTEGAVEQLLQRAKVNLKKILEQTVGK